VLRADAHQHRYQPEALPLVRHFVETFEPYEAIVAPSGSCVGSVRHQHAMVARGQGDEELARRAEAVAERTYELSELLVDVLGVEDVGAYYPHRVTYHPTCHSLRMLRVGEKPLRLLRNVRGMTLLELPDADQCCGFGGTFALKNAETSTAMLADKMRNVLDTGAEALTAGDSSCLMHIGGGHVPAAQRHEDRAPGRDPGEHGRPGPGPSLGRRCGCPRTRRAGDHQQPPHASRDRREPGMTRTDGTETGGAPAPLMRGQTAPTFLGVPAPRGVGHLRGDTSFPKAARVALQNSQLRRNLGHATQVIRTKRANVVAELDDWEQLRLAGEAMKRSTMARLDEHLERLEREVTARGGVVHWARDANEANAIVTRLVQETGETEVVKVKSMATQEIGLNEALESAGITAYETDLAELIVQLGHDMPSHILVPAIHRNRAEIREIFLREMPDVDPELTAEPRRLAMAARAHLRKRFLRAKVAVSGANFGVAETGTLLVVESEGNGRMCLTLPETLITVMGLEKVLPTWQDLEVFLQLLPRSSTGERMNPYTSAWTGVTPGDGPQRFHLVLLDNGRTATLGDEVGRDALHCIKCSACMNVCPVYERTGGHAYGSVYPGPIGAVLTPQLTGIKDNPRCRTRRRCAGRASTSARCASTSRRSWCGCAPRRSRRRGPTRACRRRRRSRWPRVVGDDHPRRFAARRGRPGSGGLLGRKTGRIGTLPPPLSGWTTSRDLPRPPAQTFREWWKSERGGK
jgi:L-lactate dehydrogenase complex protein LldF